MARSDSQTYIRLPEDLKRQLDEAASQNRRSLTAEIIARLERSFSDGPAISGVSMKDLFQKLEELERKIAVGEFVPFRRPPAGQRALDPYGAKDEDAERSSSEDDPGAIEDESDGASPLDIEEPASKPSRPRRTRR